MNSNKPKDSIRIDLRPQTWQLTSIVVCSGLVLVVVCVGGGLGGAKKHTIYRERQKFKALERIKLAE